METFSHLCAATGFICVETREENRYLHHVLSQMPSDIQVGIMSAPNGAFRAATLKNGKVFIDTKPILEPSKNPMDLMLFRVLKWASEGPGRVVLIFDWHMLCNAPVHWRAAIEAQPSIRSPLGADEAEHKASLVVFVGPSFKFEQYNPLYGEIPVLQFALPDRGGLMKRLTDDFGERDDLDDVALDALCGLSSDVAAQAAAETLQRLGRLDPASLRVACHSKLSGRGMEVWEPSGNYAGMGRFKSIIEQQVLPWTRDSTLAARRILCVGCQGTGKSQSAIWLAHKLGCDVVRLSIGAMKAGIVGASLSNLKEAFKAIDAKSKYSPLVVILDEVDKISKDGLDGGSSSETYSETLTWLQSTKSLAVVVATANHIGKLEGAMLDRFGFQFYFDLPNAEERYNISDLHFERVGCGPSRAEAARVISKEADGYTARQIAETIVPFVARDTNRKPTAESARRALRTIRSAAQIDGEGIAVIRKECEHLIPANDECDDTSVDPSPSRRITPSMN